MKSSHAFRVGVTKKMTKKMTKMRMERRVMKMRSHH